MGGEKMNKKPKVEKLPSYAFPACSTTSMMPGAFYCMEKKKANK